MVQEMIPKEMSKQDAVDLYFHSHISFHEAIVAILKIGITPTGDEDHRKRQVSVYDDYNHLLACLTMMAAADHADIKKIEKEGASELRDAAHKMVQEMFARYGMSSIIIEPQVKRAQTPAC